MTDVASQPTTPNSLAKLKALPIPPNLWMHHGFHWGKGERSRHKGPRQWQEKIGQTIEAQSDEPGNAFHALAHQRCQRATASQIRLHGMISNWAMSCYIDCKMSHDGEHRYTVRRRPRQRCGKCSSCREPPTNSTCKPRLSRRRKRAILKAGVRTSFRGQITIPKRSRAFI